MRHDLNAASMLVEQLGATVADWPTDDLGGNSLAYASAGWEVIPLRPRHKEPAIAKRDGGNGVLDASTDLTQIVAWWSKWPTANIGGRVPSGVVVVDIDPRNGGLDSWAALVAEHGQVSTRTAWSGRGDLGRHLYLRHPGGPLNATIGAGLDVKTNAGYTVLPPSIHPDSGDPYRWEDPAAPIVAAPEWLADLLRKRIETRKPTARPAGTYTGDSIADWYTDATTWGDLLGRHGWHLVSGNGDEDGSIWQHPTATSPKPAKIKYGCLFVWSPNTKFDATETLKPRGYTRFRAFAILDHGGDLSAAARSARQRREVAA